MQPLPTMSNLHAEMTEIFSSVQGEGLLVGLRQIFLRFCGCNLSCAYCDTPTTIAPEPCMVELTPGRRDFVPVENPVPFEKVYTLIEGWLKGWPGVHDSISLTGGEPLVNCQVLGSWLPRLRGLLPIYLETNGVMHEALSSVIEHIDLIGMDIKIPSTAGIADYWEDHRIFLEIAAKKKVYVKVIIGDETEDWEIIKCSEIVQSVNKTIPLILQPITLASGKTGVTPLKTLEFQEIAYRFLSEVRVIPQTHKFMGQL